MSAVEIAGVYGIESVLTFFLNSSHTVKLSNTLKTLSALHHSKMPSVLPPSAAIHIILDIQPKVALQKLSQESKFPSEREIHYFCHVYRMLAGKYGTYLIDISDLSISAICERIEEIAEEKEEASRFLVPNPDLYDFQSFSALPLVAQGESKIVRISPNPAYHLISYIPSVYSHTNQTAGMVPGTEIERMQMTREMIVLMWMYGLEHAYLYVGKDFVVTKKLTNPSNCGDSVPDITDLEVIVKNCFGGTDKQRYFNLQDRKTRTGFPVCKPVFGGSQMEYQEPYVRFDIRNPNHVYQLTAGGIRKGLKSLGPEKQEFIDKVSSQYQSIRDNVQIFNSDIPLSCESLCELLGFTCPNVNDLFKFLEVTKKPLGDYCLSESLANNFIDIKEASRTALTLNAIVKKHLAALNVYFIDFCVMICQDGKTIYGEFDQDCSRCDLITDGKLESLTKDVWRAGGSTPDGELLVKRYKILSDFLVENVCGFVARQMKVFSEGVKVALVTGGNKGIGYEIAKLIGESSTSLVLVTARDRLRGEDAVKKLNLMGTTSIFEFIEMDVTDPNSVKKASQTVKSRYGGIDVLINNAGVMFKPDCSLGAKEILRTTLDTNYYGTVSVLREFSDLLREGGRVVCVSSTEGQTALRNMDEKFRNRFLDENLTVEGIDKLVEEFIESVCSSENEAWKKAGWPGDKVPDAAYKMSKAAMTILCKVWGRDFKDGKVINSCTPRFCRTDMTDSSAPRSAAEGAVTPVWLALSQDTKHFNGLYFKDETEEPIC